MSQTSKFKDLFSKQSGDYAHYRPTYPPELFAQVFSQVKEKGLAWDCGTGNGQAAVVLAESFEGVVATDPSEKQLKQALSRPNIEYRVSSAEESGLEPQSVDLVTVAQAFHWFKHEKFYQEVRRVIKPGSPLALWSYGLSQISPEIDAQVWELYDGILGKYWEPERRWVEEGYQSIKIPFKECSTQKVSMSLRWSLDDFLGYLGTWSALQSYLKEGHENPLNKVRNSLIAHWGPGPRRVEWPLALRVFIV